MLLCGLGIGSLASQLGSVTVSSVPDTQSGEVGGLQNTITNLGISIGTALTGAIVIAALTSSFLTGVQHNSAVPPDVKSKATTELASGVRSATLSDESWRLDTPNGAVRARYVINCAGLESDLLAERMGVVPPVSIVPFRGDYYRLSERLRPRIPCLVYPVPDADVPFLGVHLTPTVDGELLAGPNAALALSREGYRSGEWTLAQLVRMATFPGTVGLAERYGTYAVHEWFKSWSRSEFLGAVRKLWPAVEEGDLVGRTAGVRAQAVRRDGSLEDDFVLVPGPRALHVLNAPSPAATAAFAIAEHIVDAVGGPTAAAPGGAPAGQRS